MRVCGWSNDQGVTRCGVEALYEPVVDCECPSPGWGYCAEHAAYVRRCMARGETFGCYTRTHATVGIRSIQTVDA